MKLDTKKIREELEKQERSVSWLARQMGESQPMLYYRLSNGLVIDADKIASVLGLQLSEVLIDEAAKE